jgi:hypothetical protein
MSQKYIWDLLSANKKFRDCSTAEKKYLVYVYVACLSFFLLFVAYAVSALSYLPGVVTTLADNSGDKLWIFVAEHKPIQLFAVILSGGILVLISALLIMGRVRLFSCRFYSPWKFCIYIIVDIALLLVIILQRLNVKDNNPFFK